MKIKKVSKENFSAALAVYTASWAASHTEICSEDFLRNRDYSGYLEKRLDGLFLLTDPIPTAIIRCWDGEIGDLYVLPKKQGHGYGTALLQFALSRGSEFTLSVLSTNERAIRLYEHMGFQFTNNRIFLREGLYELEMKYRETDNG